MAMMINREAPMSGLASLMALKGRQGDTELIHMTKPEIKGLASMGQLTVNPDTGLPEAFNLKSLLPTAAAIAATAATGGAAAPLFAGSSFIIPAAAAGLTSYAVNRDAGAAAFDALLAGAGGYLQSSAISAEAVKGIAPSATAAATQSAEAAARTAALKKAGLTGAEMLAANPSAGASLISRQAAVAGAEAARVPLSQAIPEALGSSASTKLVGDITAGQVTQAALGSAPTLAAGAAGMPMSGAGMLDQMAQAGQLQTPAGRSAQSAYGTRAGEEIKMTPQAQEGLTTEDIRQSAIGQGDPLQFFQNTQSAQAPAGVYGGQAGVVGQRSNNARGYVPAQSGGGIEALYDSMGGDYQQFSGLVEGGGVASDGMSDNVMFKVMKEENDDPDYALLSPDEYVLDAHTVAALGNGSTDSGTDRLDNFVANIRQKAYTKGEQPKELNGLRELASLMG
tara:strand:- start:1163 stop:2518 length:1356 start_codon:yes stop_codon:yes gene_type:complete